MFDSIFQHKFISFIVLVLLIGGAWYGLSSSSSGSTDLVTATPATGSSADQQLVNTLLTLRAVTLSGAILSDPTFRSLQDFSTQIVPEPVGRTDPFAPLSGSASSTGTTSPAAQNPKLFAPKTK